MSGIPLTISGPPLAPEMARYDSRMYPRKASISLFVSTPGWPVPISRPSIFVTGITSAPVPVRKHSSAVYRS